MKNNKNRNIGFVVKNDENALRASSKLEEWFNEKGFEVTRKKGFEDKSSETDFSLIFVLGGDGTFLSAARWAGNRPAPMIGVKFGEVGFLAEISEDQIFQAAKAIINGDYTVQHRIRLKITLIRNGKAILSENVLNDAVINKRSIARLARIKTTVNGFRLTTYTGDGLIISTPTGSTAYSLSSGGPIIVPHSCNFIITPISAHNLTVRPIVIPDTSIIKLKVESRSNNYLVSFDHRSVTMEFTEDIIISKADFKVKLLKLDTTDYYSTLRNKLMWGVDKRN